MPPLPPPRKIPGFTYALYTVVMVTHFTICILLLYGLYAVVMVTFVYRRMDWSSNIIGPDSMAPLAFLQDSNNVVHLNLSNCQLVLETVSHMMSSATMMFVLLGVGNIATRMLSTSVTS